MTENKKTLSFNPTGVTPTVNTGQASIPTTPRKRGNERNVMKSSTLQASGDH